MYPYDVAFEKGHATNYKVKTAKYMTTYRKNSCPPKVDFMLHSALARTRIKHPAEQTQFRHEMPPPSADVQKMRTLFGWDAKTAINQPRSCLSPSMTCSLFEGFICAIIQNSGH